MKTFTMTPGKYVITDACMTYYYDDFILDGFMDFDRGESDKFGSTVLVCTGGDGAGYVRDMDNELVGQFGTDAANISIFPVKVIRDGGVPDHYGTFVEFDEEFEVKVYHDAMVIGDRYRVRY